MCYSKSGRICRCANLGPPTVSSFKEQGRGQVAGTTDTGSSLCTSACLPPSPGPKGAATGTGSGEPAVCRSPICLQFSQLSTEPLQRWGCTLILATKGNGFYPQDPLLKSTYGCFCAAKHSAVPHRDNRATCKRAHAGAGSSTSMFRAGLGTLAWGPHT